MEEPLQWCLLLNSVKSVWQLLQLRVEESLSHKTFLFIILEGCLIMPRIWMSSSGAASSISFRISEEGACLDFLGLLAFSWTFCSSASLLSVSFTSICNF